MRSLFHFLWINKALVAAVILWAGLWLSAFLFFQPGLVGEVMNNLQASIVWPNNANIAWDVYYTSSNGKLKIYSNIDRDDIQLVTIYVSKSPEVEILVKKSATNSIEALWPSMSKYNFEVNGLKTGFLIASFDHNGDKEDISLGEITVRTDAMQEEDLAITNAN